MSTFEAQFHSTCSACGWHISPGDFVRWAEDMERVVIHDVCATTSATAPRLIGDPCGRCFTTHLPGHCEYDL